MRLLVLFLLAGAAVAQARLIFTNRFAVLPDLTAGILLPLSDAIFNVTRHAPKNDGEWTAVQAEATERG